MNEAERARSVAGGIPPPRKPHLFIAGGTAAEPLDPKEVGKAYIENRHNRAEIEAGMTRLFAGGRLSVADVAAIAAALMAKAAVLAEPPERTAVVFGIQGLALDMLADELKRRGSD